MSVELIADQGDRWQVRGDLTFATVLDALARSRPLLGTAAGDLCIDLAGVARADSAGIALLLEWMRMAAAAGRTVRFCGMPAQMHAIARVSDLDHVLPLAAEA